MKTSAVVGLVAVSLVTVTSAGFTSALASSISSCGEELSPTIEAPLLADSPTPAASVPPDWVDVEAVLRRTFDCRFGAAQQVSDGSQVLVFLVSPTAQDWVDARWALRGSIDETTPVRLRGVPYGDYDVRSAKLRVTAQLIPLLGRGVNWSVEPQVVAGRILVRVDERATADLSQVAQQIQDSGVAGNIPVEVVHDASIGRAMQRHAYTPLSIAIGQSRGHSGQVAFRPGVFA
ncbi:unannotated protein [freshwater metagenome]|uniref:Unannotated protein n=1 Tax=freshwater metagenome TaxID=449393 RepID=A0A6J6XFV2_9ZZZZ